ncbi:MAG: hypothetical protein JNL70_12345 [Saprospiraceae bacterium]|nr:hypothetical protein [Saprospiraceae bacterium]
MKKQLIQLHFANYFTKFFLVSLITNSAVSEAQKLSVTPSLFSQEERSHPITYFKKLTDGSLSLLELKPETKQADAPVVCYTITNPSAAQTICVDATGSNITVNTNMNLGGGIRFVRFTTDQMAGSTPTLAESNFIYSYTPGTFKDIAYATPTGGSSPYTATYTFYSPDFPNTTNAPITYYVYAVFNQGVVNSTCGINPAVEIQITVKPKPTVNAIADQYVCAGSATSAVTLTGSGVSGTTYAWTNTTTSIGLAASGSTTIPSFTAVNATSNPVTATITATPTANSCTGDPLTSKIVVYPTGATMISGVAFNDYNENGIREAAEGVQAGIVAKVYNSAGTLMGTSTTDANGYWSVSGLTFGGANDKYRVEFSIPTALSTTGMQPSVKGTSNGTDVQFVSAASCNINFGVNYPGVYCQTNPVLATPCYTNGSRASNPNDAAVVLFNYNDRGQGLSHEMIATVSEVGAVWGETYNPKNKKLYVSAFIKRHVDLAPNGLGAIYEIDVTTPTTAGAGTPTLWLDINAATFVNTSNVAVNLGMPADPGIATRGLGLKTDPSRDNWAFDYVGKQGIGDIELSQDGQRLYVMDLTNRQVLCIDYTTKKLIWKLAVSTPTCAGGSTDIRPWALKEHNGVLYVGALCSGETNNNAGQLHFYIMQCNSLTAATSMSLTADLGSSVTKQDGTPWQYWAANATEAGIASTPNDGYMNGAQPIISNIDFDKDENMIIGFMDRFGHQVGFANYLPNTTNTNLVHGIAHGDITRATKSGSTYTVETAPWSFFYLTAAIPSPPYDHFGGGMFVSSLSGTNYVTANVIDPFDYVSAGTTWVKTSDGQRQGGTNATSRLEIVPNSTSTAYFGKANGLGDLSAFCNPAPIQIGNYVWYDLNKNGVQDPNEIPLSNIAVTLWKGGTQIASTTTDANGEYYFSDKNASGVTWTGTGADTTLLPSMAYEVRILTSQSPLSNRILTTANATTNNGNDQNDSDATTSGSYSVISFATGAAGSVNHTLDFGFYCTPPTIISVASNTANCTNGIAISNAWVAVRGIAGMAKYAYRTNSTDSLWANTATTSTTDSIRISNIANPSVATTYTFRIWASDTTCYNDTTVTLYPINCAPCSQAIMYVCGFNKYNDALSFDHGMIDYLRAKGHSVTPAQVYFGTLQNPETGNPLMAFSPYDKIIVSHSAYFDARDNSANLLDSLKATTAGVLMLTSAAHVDLGLGTSDGFDHPSGNMWIENNSSPILPAGLPNGTIAMYNDSTTLGLDNYSNIIGWCSGVGSSAIIGAYRNSQPDPRVAYFGYRKGATLANNTIAPGNRFFLGFLVEGASRYQPQIQVTDPTNFFTAEATLILDAALEQTCPCCTPPSVTSVASTVATCSGSSANNDATVAVRGITGMAKYAYSTSGATGLFSANATSSTADSIKLTGLANPLVATTYTFRIWATDTLCYNDTTVVLNPQTFPTTPSVSSPITNICPLTTVDLTVISSALTPSVSGGVFEWHVSNSSGSALVMNQNTVGAGDYYLFERSPASCYSTGKKVTVAIQVCCPSPACIPVTITRTN